MSLLVWLPLISDTKNQGLSDPTITTTGTLTYDNGKIGKALTFNNSALTLKPAPLNTNTKEFSFAFWFKPTSTNSYQCLYNGRTAVGSAIAIFRDPSNLWRFDDGALNTFDFGTIANEWHHYVFTWNETNIKLYIDGELKQTLTSTSFTCDTATASIGMSSISGSTPKSNPIIGQLNDYRIYNHILSVKEIKELAKGLLIHLPLVYGVNNPYIDSEDTGMSLGSMFIEDCSGYNHDIKKVGSNFSYTTSPKGLGGTLIGASSAINLGTIAKVPAPMTITMWFKATSTEDYGIRLMSCTQSGGYAFEKHNNLFCFAAGCGTTSNTYKFVDSTYLSNDLLNAWHHTAVTYDGTTAKIYVDGALNNTATWSAPLYYHATNSVWLKAEATASNTTATYNNYEISYADFRIYTTVLTADDIKELYSIAAHIDKAGNMYCNSFLED